MTKTVTISREVCMDLLKYVDLHWAELQAHKAEAEEEKPQGWQRRATELQGQIEVIEALMSEAMKQARIRKMRL